LLAIAAAVIWLVYPVLKGGYYLLTSPRIRSVRARAITVSVVLAAILIGFIMLVPMPYRSSSEGVVWIPEEAFVRAGAEGFIKDISAASGSRVTNGETLMTLDNPILAAEEKVLVARIQEVDARRLQFLTTKPVEAAITVQDLHEARERLKRTREEIRDLSVRSRTDGTLVVPVPEDLPGRFVRKGELIGYVLELDRVTLRTVVSQDRIDMVRNGTYGVQVRLSERLTQTVPAIIKRIIPGATESLPAPALGTAGGGKIATDPTDRRGLTAVDKVFQIDLELPSRSDLVNLGGRAYVRFDHGWTPLAVQWYFKIRHLFLSRFNV
jgi:putative peptide zinc metalloprotease protein